MLEKYLSLGGMSETGVVELDRLVTV